MPAQWPIGTTMPDGSVSQSDTFVTLANGTTVEVATSTPTGGSVEYWYAAIGGTPLTEAQEVARAVNAIKTNDTFLALASPTTAQVTAQVQALSRQMDAVLVWLLNPNSPSVL